MDLVGSNGFFIFLFFFHSIIGFFGIYRMRVRQTVDNPDSQFVAMPQTITPAGIELNIQYEVKLSASFPTYLFSFLIGIGGIGLSRME